MGRQRSGWSALIARFSRLAGIAALSLPAVSHDWYPMECCRGSRGPFSIVCVANLRSPGARISRSPNRT